MMKKCAKYLKFILRFGFICFILFILVNLGGYLYAYCSEKIDIKSANTFFMYDSKETLVFQGNGKDNWILLRDMPDDVINATLAVEDKKFYEHNGFDFLRMLKAMFENIVSGEIVQGASSITQQYARNLFLDFEQTWERKWKEMWLTFKLEAHYSKDEILEGYLNTINYGNVYGIGNASKYYYNKELKDLNLAEISMLVGIPNSPSNYSPILNYDLAKERQKVVLERMYANGYITEAEMQYAYDYKLELYGEYEEEEVSSLLYYKDAVLNELEQLNTIPKSYLETGGIKIYTTLDMTAQRALDESVKENLVDDKIEVAKVMLEANTGGVVALIGGSDYEKTQYNRALDSIRQPGSTVKPFLYYKALENGFTASTAFLSSETTFYFDNRNKYSPKNSGGVYGNKDISMAAAVAYSDNIYAVKTHLFLNDSSLLNILKDLGITTKLEDSPSLPLGSYEVNIIELANAYASLANSGKKVTPHFITKVEDINGNILYQYKAKENYILDPVYTFLVSELLTTTYDNNMVDYTTPTCFSLISDLTHKYALKSGSTDTDAWVIGYNKDYVLASWAGYDDNSDISTKVVSSNKKSWAYAMETLLKGKEDSWYDIPKNVVGVLVNPINGKIATANSKNKRILYYIEGTQPTEYDE